MHLIDADKLVESMEKYCENHCQYQKEHRPSMCGVCQFGDAFDVVHCEPLAEKRGKWTREFTPSTMYFYRYRCSVCDWTSEDATKYCCHCGARMVNEDERLDK